MQYVTIASIILLSFSLASSISYAKSPSLIGSWHGGGVVQPTSGAKEKTRCRANIEKAPSRGLYNVTYRCSSPYGLISQNVMVKKTGANRYTGGFYNAQHKIRGFINIILNGNKQTVTLKTSNGKGWFNLQKR